MWFTGRFNGAATVRVLEPSQVTGLPGEAGGWVVVCRGAGFVPPEPADPERPGARDETGSAAEGEADGAAVEVAAAVGVVRAAGLVPAPSARAPEPSSPHAVRESAASATVAAAVARRTRDVRMPDMVRTSFAVDFAVVVAVVPAVAFAGGTGAVLG
jgi:hypothetical protein